MAVSQQTLRLPRQRASYRHADHRAPRSRRFRPDLAGKSAIGGLLLGVLALFVLVGPLVWTTQPQQQDLSSRLATPALFGRNGTHPLGSDQLGRDTLALLLAGTRTSLVIAAISSGISALMGTVLGLVSGFKGGLIRGVVDWAIDVQLAIPFVVVAIALTATFGNSFASLAGTLVVTGWLAYARVVQVQVRTLRQTEWILAARATGASTARIMTCHLAPSILGTVGVLLTQQAGAMIFYEASLSSLGLGLGGSAVTLGGLVSQGREAIFVAPWLAVFPGAVIAWAILGLNLLGDGISERGRRLRR
jgi:peptide/nickel transport system permease protein